MAQETKDAILEAAADLFGEQGFDNVSVRDITNRAEVNLSALSYHFTDKAGLIENVIHTYVEKLNLNRINLLAKANLDHDNKPPLRALIEAFVAPIFLPEIHKTKPSIVAALTARTMIQQDANNPYNHETFKEAVEKFVAAFQLNFPALPVGIMKDILKLSAGTAVTFRSFAYNTDGLVDLKATTEVYTVKLNELLDYCEAGAKCLISKASQ